VRRERIIEDVGSGTAELVPDNARPDGWTLLVDGVPQSYVDLDDPRYLEFEYMRRLAAAVDAAAPAGAPLRVLHLGGGALTMPRYIAATRPGSGQLVVERDAALAALVRRVLPLPRRGGIRIRTGDAREQVEALPDSRFDLVIGDVYAGAQMPRSVASVEFAAQVARVLGETGWYAVNVADLRPLAFSKIQAVTLATAFADVAMLAEPGMLRGRRYGNVVFVASVAPAALPVTQLSNAVRRDPFPGRVLHGDDLATFVGGAKPANDTSAKDSPLPPPSIFS
jgi:hypothetical protein